MDKARVDTIPHGVVTEVEPHSRRRGWLRGVAALAGLVTVLLVFSGCTPLGEYIHNGFKVGPNYVRPPAPVAHEWIEVGDPKVQQTPSDTKDWWKVFHDPKLDALVCLAYGENLTLRQAAYRVLQAADRAIVAGELFPQTQQATGDYVRSESGRETAGKHGSFSSLSRFASQWDLGFNLSWEIDFWGGLRRAVESADANLDAQIDNYDQALVTLVADVANNYVLLRTAQERIKLVEENVKLQYQTYELAKAKLKVGVAVSLDVQQSLSTLKQTEALIPPLQIAVRQASNHLCTLLGIPPEDLVRRLGQEEKVPAAANDVVVGIPADLLRRRPDVRAAERQAAAQSAQIGIAEADFYPHIFINGTLGWSASEFKYLFRSDAMTGSIGPSFRWNILNYGRILNGVRREDALFIQAVLNYQASVLAAQEEVENALVVFLRSQEQYTELHSSSEATKTAVDLLVLQLKFGVIDFNRLALLEQNLVQQQDTEAQAQGNVALGLIQVYRALGGGWELRLTGCDPNGDQQGKPPEAAPQPQTVPAAYSRYGVPAKEAPKRQG